MDLFCSMVCLSIPCWFIVSYVFLCDSIFILLDLIPPPDLENWASAEDPKLYRASLWVFSSQTPSHWVKSPWDLFRTSSRSCSEYLGFQNPCPRGPRPLSGPVQASSLGLTSCGQTTLLAGPEVCPGGGCLGWIGRTLDRKTKVVHAWCDFPCRRRWS